MNERGCSIAIGVAIIILAAVLSYYAITIVNTPSFTPDPTSIEAWSPLAWILAGAALGVLLILYGLRKR